jgi:hypothetical protein
MSADARPTQLPVGPLVAALGAVVLLVSLFLDWYEGLTGFTVFEFVDIVLAACALLTLVALAGAMGVLRDSPLSSGMALVVAVFALAVVLVQLVNDPPAVAGGTGPDRDIGLWLAVAGAALMAAGAILATAHISLAIEPRERPAAAAARGEHDPAAARGEHDPAVAPGSEAPTQTTSRNAPLDPDAPTQTTPRDGPERP